ncbi:MAG TPA: polysaccharide biosynthesis tyrosine autokinase [Bacteroidales bacterium]|nr:polysaccharide biosynthesis tyrosine autokinase [Bacteroidales bacterium]
MEKKTKYIRPDWYYITDGEFGKWIETEDLSIVLIRDSTVSLPEIGNNSYGFTLRTISSLNNEIKNTVEFKLVDRLATVIEIRYKNESVEKGTNIVNEIMKVYSQQNLNRKNHIANITIDLIEKQLNEISDSLIQTEDNLQKFRSSNQLLNITDQAAGLTSRYFDLQNLLAEMMSRKRYYDYVSDYLIKNDNFSNMMLPAAMGIPDQMLNTLISELVSAQAQQSNLIENNQAKNPLVSKLGIQIENLKKTISQNITEVGKTTRISIDEMNKRITKMEMEISRLPSTQRKLGTIERKYRLNDAIYNYLLEKRAEAKITQASNLPDDIIIEPAGLVGIGPVTPNKMVNYIIAFFLGIFMPMGFLTVKSILNNQIDSQEDLERLVNDPVMGNILHNNYKTRNIMREFQKSNIAESFRALRTNLDFYLRGGNKKVILVSSCIQGEGKTFVSTNLAISYAQLGRKTIIVSFDLRKSDPIFKDQESSEEGLSSYLANKIELENIILRSVYENLDYIPAGILPPNPVELIALERTSSLMSELRIRYDVIIIDSTPLAQFSDAYLLLDHAELKVIIARQNYSVKKIFANVMKDLQQKNINNICIVLNDNKMYFDQYGYGYKYNYKGPEKRIKKSKNGALKNIPLEKVTNSIMN